MLRELTGIVITIIPYLFPVFDFLIWLLSGNAYAIAGVFGNLINIFLNLGLRALFGRMFSCSGWIYAPELEEKPACGVDPPAWVVKKGLVIEMPSIHAQQVAYYAIYWLLVLAYSLDVSMSAIRKVLALTILEVFAFMVCYMRYSLEYNSLAQIVAGYIIGSLWGVGYFFFVNYLANL